MKSSSNYNLFTSARLTPKHPIFLKHRGAPFLLCSFLLVAFQNCTKSHFKTYDQTIMSSQDLSIRTTPDLKKEDPPLEMKKTYPPGCATEVCAQEELNALNLLKRLEKPTSTMSCLDNTAVNACVFYKNPVASQGSAFPTVINSTQDLSRFQNLGVTMEPTSYNATNGCLTNSSYSILTNVEYTQNPLTGGSSLRASPSCFPNLQFKSSYNGNDTTRSVAQIMTHYYLNHQKSFMVDWTGSWYAANKNIAVFSFVNHPNLNNNAYFQSDMSSGQKKGSIILPAWTAGTTIPGGFQETALSAEVYLHEAGHGNLFFSSDPIDSATKNRLCRASSTSPLNVCCTTIEGCSRAINEGIADYHALIMFPESPSIGDSLSNNAKGFLSFGLFRNYGELGQLMPQQAFDLPTNNSLDGEIHLMGYVWTSLWYEARLEAKKQFGSRGIRSLDKLFSKHLLIINGESTFTNLCTETINEASSIDEGLVKEIFKKECQRRNLI